MAFVTRRRPSSDEGSRRLAIMAHEVRAGLTRTPRSLPTKYLYDARGSRLFDAICDAPEYYLTRAEQSLLERRAEDIVGTFGRVGPAALVEIGSGMARKTGVLLRALSERGPSLPRYVAFDLAPTAIEASARALRSEFPRLLVRGIVGDFAADFARQMRRIEAAAPAAHGARLFAFLGSTIGNLEDADAPALLHAISQVMTDRDRLVVGVDLVKDPRMLGAAYNDAQGLTAAFNKNLLRAIARDLDGDFDTEAFAHLAFYNAGRQRIEMHLVSERRQSIALRAIGLHAKIEAGEHVMTEISRKFTRASAETMMVRASLRLEQWHLSPDGPNGPDGACALAVARRAR